MTAGNGLTGGKLPDPVFKVILSKSAEKYFIKLNQGTKGRLRRCFLNLELNPLALGDIKPVKNKDGYFRYRVGDLRVIYFCNFAKRRVEITSILPRGQAYKRK